jgi:hypothetical protein
MIGKVARGIYGCEGRKYTRKRPLRNNVPERGIDVWLLGTN